MLCWAALARTVGSARRLARRRLAVANQSRLRAERYLNGLGLNPRSCVTAELRHVYLRRDRHS